MKSGRHFLKAIWSLAVLTAAAGSATFAQTASVVDVPRIAPQDLLYSTNGVQNIYTSPPTLTLIKRGPQAHSGDIWVRTAADGLHVWGKIEAAEQGFHWPEQKSETLSSDHIEIWLAASRDVPMPRIGWGNQFGAIELDSAKDCPKQQGPEVRNPGCERWYNEQTQYRVYLRQLFMREWLIAGSMGSPHAYEGFASEAYRDIMATLYSENLPTELKPKSDYGVSAEIGTDRRPEVRKNAGGGMYNYNVQTGYHFHALIPYGAFPPAQQLRLSDLYFMVDVFTAAPAGQQTGDYSSTAAMGQWDTPSTFNHLVLAAPRSFSITPCEYRTVQQDLYGTNYTSWFFPLKAAGDTNLRSTFALINPAGGYMYAPAGVSPEAQQANYFWKELPEGATVCGPQLAWRKGNAITQSEFTVDRQRFKTKSMPDGWTLVRSGPSESTLSSFGSGQCGSCPVIDFDVFAISPKGEITNSLFIHDNLGGIPSEGHPVEADLTITRDWKHVILYLETEGWSSTTYCLEGHAYKECGQAKKVQPPNPPHFKEFRLPQ